MPVRSLELVALASYCPVGQAPDEGVEVRATLVPEEDRRRAEELMQRLKDNYPTVSAAIKPPMVPEKAEDTPSIRPDRRELARAFATLLDEYNKALLEGRTDYAAFVGALAERMIRAAILEPEVNQALIQEYGTNSAVTIPPPVPVYWLQRMTPSSRPVVAAVVTAHYIASQVGSDPDATTRALLETLLGVGSHPASAYDDLNSYTISLEARRASRLQSDIKVGGKTADVRTWSLLSQLGRAVEGEYPMYAPMYAVLAAAGLVQSGEFTKSSGGAGTLTETRQLLVEKSLTALRVRTLGPTASVLAGLGDMPYADNAMARWGQMSMGMVARIQSPQGTAASIIDQALPRDRNISGRVSTTGLTNIQNVQTARSRYMSFVESASGVLGSKLAEAIRFANTMPLLSIDCMRDARRLSDALSALNDYLNWALTDGTSVHGTARLSPAKYSDEQVLAWLTQSVNDAGETRDAIRAYGALVDMIDCFPRLKALEAAMGESFITGSISAAGDRYVVTDHNAFLRARFYAGIVARVLWGEQLQDERGNPISDRELARNTARWMIMSLFSMKPIGRLQGRGKKKRLVPRWYMFAYDAGGGQWVQLRESPLYDWLRDIDDVETQAAQDVAEMYFLDNVANGISLRAISYELIMAP